MSVGHVDVLHSEIPEVFQSRDLSPTWDDASKIMAICRSPRRKSLSRRKPPPKATLYNLVAIGWLPPPKRPIGSGTDDGSATNRETLARLLPQTAKR
jgi:hypothetical protein